MHVIDALVLCLLPIAVAIPSLFYFQTLDVDVGFVFFTALITIPLSVSIYWLLRIPSYSSSNKFYLLIFIFFVTGSLYQVQELGIRALDMIAFKDGLVAKTDGSEFKIPILAGFLAWAKILLIFTSSRARYLKPAAIFFVIIFEVILNFKRSALIFIIIPFGLSIYRSRRHRIMLFCAGLIVAVVFGLLGDFRESGEDVFSFLNPMSDSSTVNWILTYTSVNYHVAYQKYLDGGHFDLCYLFIIFTNDAACASDFSLYGFNATTYIGNFTGAGIGGLLFFQLVFVGFSYAVSKIQPISSGLYLYINTLWLLNIFGAYWLGRNFGLLLIAWILFDFVKRLNFSYLVGKRLVVPRLG